MLYEHRPDEPRFLAPGQGAYEVDVAGSASPTTGTSLPTASHEYTKPASAAPMIGANQNSQSCASAQPPTKSAGPVLRAGLTDRFVTGIPIRWISVSDRPIAIPARPAGA